MLQGCLKQDPATLASIGAADDVCQATMALYRQNYEGNQMNNVCAFAPAVIQSLTQDGATYNTAVADSTMYRGDYSTDGTQNEQ